MKINIYSLSFSTISKDVDYSYNLKYNLKLEKLKEIDQKVKAHEEAHFVKGVPYTSYPEYKYVKGPDGRNYAISGDVKIDTSPERDPKKTIEKMEKVIQAALAPTNPSFQDLQVAAKAKIELEKAKQKLEEYKHSWEI